MVVNTINQGAGNILYAMGLAALWFLSTVDLGLLTISQNIAPIMPLRHMKRVILYGLQTAHPLLIGSDAGLPYGYRHF